MRLTPTISAFAVLSCVSIFSCVVILRETPEYHHNKFLPGYVFKGMWKISLHECIAECGSRTSCASGNYFRLMLLCQLNFRNNTSVTLSDQAFVLFFEMSDKVIEDIKGLFCGNEACASGRRCSENRDSNPMCRIEECDDDPTTESNTSIQDNKLVNYVGARRLVTCKRNENPRTGANPPTTTLATSRCGKNGTWEPPSEICSSNVSDIFSTTSSSPPTTNATATTSTPEACDSGWKLSGSYCYRIQGLYVGTWQAAEINCQSYRASLASFRKQDQLKIFEGESLSILKSYYWINANSYNFMGTFSTDGDSLREIEIHEWRKGPYPPGANFLHFDIQDFWFGTQLHYLVDAGFICRKYAQLVKIETSIETKARETTETPFSTTTEQDLSSDNVNTTAGTTHATTESHSPTKTTDTDICEVQWSQFDGYCYQISTQILTEWHKARESCLEVDSELVTVSNEKQLAFLANLTSLIDPNYTEDSYWIGGKYLDDWQWVPLDDSHARKITYMEWHPDEGDDFYEHNTEKCLTLKNYYNPSTVFTGTTRELKYKSVDCHDGNPMFSLCQREIISGFQTSRPETEGSTSSPIITPTKAVVSKHQNTPTPTMVDDYASPSSTTMDERDKTESPVTPLVTRNAYTESPAPTVKTSTTPTTATTMVTDETDAENFCDEDGEMYNSQCFYFKLEPINEWTLAKIICEKSRYVLASIHDQDQFDFFNEKLHSLGIYMGDTFWIGGKCLEGSWYWGADISKPVRFTNWGTENEAYCTNNTCLALEAGGFEWFYTSVPCNGSTISRYVICEKEHSQLG